MITSEVVIRINYDDADEIYIRNARDLIQKICEEFEKAGSGTEHEQSVLKETEHILDEILRKEVF